jgi:diguanylate cyclase (GGDEF)-like protein/PAS domain S-box-containing protein
LLGSFNRLQKHIETQNRSLLDNAAQMRLTASVFEGTSEAILISSADNLIVSVNRAFCRMTGYDETELIGKNPRLLQSGRHDAAFYQEMWSSLQHTGQWQGEIWNRRKNGEIYPERLSISTLSDEAGNLIRYIALAADIAKQKQAESVIWQQANYDLLTFLPNRHLLQSRMHEAVDRAQRNGLPFAVLHIDLDHFSDVNSLLGHGFGDRLLIEVGNRISSCVGKDSDAVSHLGGDEFVVLINALRDPGLQEAQLAAKILQAISAPIFLGNETVFITASIGVAVYPDDAVDVPGLLVDVYQAKLSAKQEGGNRTCRQTAGMRIATQMRMQLANDLRGALAANQLEVYYQPVVDLASGRVIKAEALLRWHHPTRGMILPALFIPIAEETGLINEIGDWVFREAAKMAKRWCDLNRTGTYRIGRGMGTLIAAPDRGQFQVNINKSPRQFFAGNTEKTWIHYMKQNNIEPGCIAIEITEGLLLDHHPDVVAKLNAIREFGIELALDDFGTGYSSMSYLKRFDIDYLKIDRSFVQDIVTDPSDLAITEALIAMAHKLGMKVVAEGVETIEQRNLLADAGCDLGQGYFFAIPMPAAQFESLVFAAGNALHSKALLAGA